MYYYSIQFSQVINLMWVVMVNNMGVVGYHGNLLWWNPDFKNTNRKEPIKKVFNGN